MQRLAHDDAKVRAAIVLPHQRHRIDLDEIVRERSEGRGQRRLPTRLLIRGEPAGQGHVEAKFREDIRIPPALEQFDLARRQPRGEAPLAVAQIKRVSAAGDLDEGIEAEKRAFADVFASADAREGIAAFLGKRAPRFTGE